ncbi:DNA-binding transcriptional LysR family regulator [Pelomonas saccharophila]|uniref:DNA-binding transcriptional LysR family regulator n=1 Tax=Roseateles saccharophilus TaxID=304 RepID=A0ABU1YUT1_ROSSA|nr:LysR family transcriptional regulator [Roseateles saccharophilus]MDR7271721.1 DNA-binding transcriptional LysR family regulator [Roseateles saccharophilus]
MSTTFDRLLLMQTFIRIVEAGSLSAAARQLGTTQPTVSRRLQALERQLGQPLVQRSTHALRLTETGQRAYARAKALAVDWECFEQSLRAEPGLPEGLLRVQVPHAFGQEHLIPSLVQALKAAPGLRVDWLLNDAPPNFIEQGLDCAIRVGGKAEGSVVAIELARVPRVLVAAPALVEGRRIATPDDLAELPWVALYTFYRQEVALKREGDGERARIAIRPVLATDSLYATREAVRLGLGAALLSGWSVREDIAQGRLVQLLPPWRGEALPVHLLYPNPPAPPARLRYFIEAMRRSMAGPLWPDMR